MYRRVVITGLGVCAPNAIGLESFGEAMAKGKGGIRFQPRLKALKFGCQIAGAPILTDERLKAYFTPLQLRGLKATGIIYGVMAGCDAWADAGLTKAPRRGAPIGRRVSFSVRVPWASTSFTRP